MRSARAVAVGLFAEVVAVFAFYGIAQQPGYSPGYSSWRLLTFLFVGTLTLIGVVSTWFARRHATPGAGKGVATLVSGAIFAALILYLWALVVAVVHSG